LHPNVAIAHDADQEGDTHFFVMEYIEGEDLSRLVKRSGALPVGRACDYIRQAALGLQHAHERGLVHRDIKPSNLMLTKAQGLQPLGLVKVLDLGLALLSLPGEEGDALTREGSVMGTPDFMAPEQASDSHGVDIRSDLYSLGCTLYFLLTARVPFPGGSPLDKLVRHVSEEPAPVQSLRGDLPPELAAIVGRLMAKSPADRFQSPIELANALAHFAVQGPAALPVHVPDSQAGPGSSDSPWANIFDDASPATMRTDATVSPVPVSLRVKRSTVIASESRRNLASRVFQVAIIA